ncbi:hypothetical protein [Alkaliphilus transvaalensis]|uniref:hypothetical protein n=1 Tax=Alkaliphilus transvaalensis TaxID=114628 RepID=UPI0004797DD4|nr:hypothetical protein [Alkaliphilus transvaalensis]
MNQLLYASIALIINSVVGYCLYKGKYKIETLYFPLFIVLFGNINIISSIYYIDLSTFIAAIIITNLFVLLLYLIAGLSIGLAVEADKVDEALSSQDFFKNADIKIGKYKKEYILPEGAKVSLSGKKNATVTITSKLSIKGIMKVREELLPILTELDGRKVSTKESIQVGILGLSLLVFYYFMS